MKQTIAIFYVVMISFSCTTGPNESLQIVPGVSEEIAWERKQVLTNIFYSLSLNIPENKAGAIRGKLELSFDLSNTGTPLILDFNVDSTHLINISISGSNISYTFYNEHIIIEPMFFSEGANTLTIDFIAGDLSLNRNDEYLYTLFVPDRASSAFPCFDQPDLKAGYQLQLNIPEHWKAITNTPVLNATSKNGRKTIKFGKSKPISSYLFAFAAGKFHTETHEFNGRTMTMFYRETDTAKVRRNSDKVFELHSKALDWLESYTDIEYPFTKFDFALIPSFQYGGMEHPGSIFYRESSLFLNESATLNDELGRASLISHETAHMWFGDLVTMNWFDDVWVKEVFANFMADKIVNPSFPDINPHLKFLLRHFPAAYSVDRTAGANAIKQPLENLKQAGMMYGAIIYNKAPVMMKHLENLTGEEAFRDGLRSYLSAFAYKNSDWNDLISILSEKTEKDLKSWSKTWIETPGMPNYTYLSDNKILKINQYDANNGNKLWIQDLQPTVSYNDGFKVFNLNMTKLLDEINLGEMPGGKINYTILNGDGLEYGGFILDDQSIDYLLQNVVSEPDAYNRGKIWLDLYESLLNGRIDPINYFNALKHTIPLERDKQIVNTLLSQFRRVFWKFLPQQRRTVAGVEIEDILWKLINSPIDHELKTAFFRTYVNIGRSKNALANMYGLWNSEFKIDGLPLGENDYITLVYSLAVKGFNNADVLMALQEERIENPDRKQRFAFIRPALSNDPTVRDLFFESLKHPEYREHEPWVITSLQYLHHPERSNESIKYILPSLELLEEVQLTGDIFFPKRWLDATLSGHQTREAADIVRQFLNDYPEYNHHLRDKILQSADMLYRAQEITGKYGEIERD